MSKNDTHVVVTKRDNRQDQIDRMEVGDSVAVARRLSLDFGMPKDTIAAHLHALRGTLDQQCNRVRRKKVDRKFIVESGTYITRDGAVMISVVATRTD